LKAPAPSQGQKRATAGTSNGRNKQRQERATAGTSNGRNKQRQEQATAGTGNGKNKQRQERATAGTSNGRNKQRQEAIREKGEDFYGYDPRGRSFDCASCDKTARGFAQDDRFVIGQIFTCLLR
jgi:hypothetical protein